MTELSLYDYELPENLIASEPVDQRDASRLLCIEKRTGNLQHRRFHEITNLLNPSDVLVINDARVIPARLRAHRATGGKVEVLLVRRADGRPPAAAGNRLRWIVMLGSSGSLREGEKLHLDSCPGSIRLIKNQGKGYWTLQIHGESLTLDDIFAAGNMPLPPYIRRKRRQLGQPESQSEIDRERYQTVFAERPGAVAAPTAGLHYTTDLLNQLRNKGVQVCPLSLMVGPGTFQPIRTERVEQHTIDPEFYRLPHGSAAIIRTALEEKRRIVATGTTCCRVLEYVVREKSLAGHAGWTDLYIHPPFEFRVVDALITNFHLPKSSLLVLVSAFAGRENIINAYKVAVEEGYRFYSYGDATFIS
ncbi:MAG: tRNA preQ1(34) S-adenosylmethionine ribosyltransferase-isomerase QueA [Planctomycetes bacterium]|nr:tRNA preQ1(34) S-adenosylmethionine ribosyltransferase-isomerase QueA [Planctomycetota bacterium]